MINRYMRLIVMFDLPVVSESDKRKYIKFRSFLLDDGYIMMQYSVYSRICKNRDDANKHLIRLRMKSPKSGNIRALQVTENQYENMEIIWGSKKFEENISDKNLVVF